MDIIKISKEEYLAVHESLYPWYWVPPKTERTPEKEMITSLITRLRMRPSMYGPEMWPVPKAVAQYCQKSLLDKPYLLMRAVYEICKDGMGENPEFVYSLGEQYLIRYLNQRLQKEKKQWRYYDPYGKIGSHISTV